MRRLPARRRGQCVVIDGARPKIAAPEPERESAIDGHPGRDMSKETLRNVLAIVGIDADELREVLRVRRIQVMIMGVFARGDVAPIPEMPCSRW